MRRLRDWPIARKGLLVLVLASPVPIAIGGVVGYMRGRDLLEEQVRGLLAARSDMVATTLDDFNRGWLGSATRLASMPPVRRFCEASRLAPGEPPTELSDHLDVYPRSDPAIRAASLIVGGRIAASTERRGVGVDVSFRSYWRESRDRPTISDVFVPLAVIEPDPLLAYSAPVSGSDGECVVLIAVKATRFWEAVRAQNGAAGKDAYAVVLDQHGIRIAHGTRQAHVFRPAGTVPRTEIEQMRRERRFDERTLGRLSQPVAVPDQFRLARTRRLGRSEEIHAYYSPANDSWNFSVARRLETVPWTVFVLVPSASVDGPIRALVGSSVLGAALLSAFALTLGALFGWTIFSPLRSLSAAADSLGRGDYEARVAIVAKDEIGALASRFNEMAAAIQAAHDSLEQRVHERTADLERANAELGAQREELVVQREELVVQQGELERTNAEVARADRLKSEFLANMSHELRTPLNAVIGFSEILRDDGQATFTPRQMEQLGHVYESGKHLLALINDILDLSKIEAGHLALTEEIVAPREAVTEACALCEPSAKKRRVAIAPLVRTRLSVRADRAKLRQILLNLLSNAVKFAPEGSTVRVEAEDQHPFVRFSVSDDGSGIDEALLPRLFEPFVQGESPLVKKHQGTGLGLAITRRLVQKHGGTVSVETAPGRGATFRFTIPAGKASVPADTDPSVTEPAKGRRILVIDDDPRVGEVLRSALAGDGLLLAATGREGIAIARSERPDLAIVDLSLPDLSGFEVVDRIAKEVGTIPMIVLTAADLTADEIQRLRGSVEIVAIKGDVTREELVAAVERTTSRGSRVRTADPSVLVVDDNDVNRELARSILERLGYRVLLAADGDEGLAVARREGPALVLMDLAMPGKDGYAATRELKADPATRRIPVVALTALAMRGDEERAIEAGVDAFLTKPIDRAKLEEIVARFVPPPVRGGSP